MKNDNKKNKKMISRRSTLKGIGAVGALAFMGQKTAYGKETRVENPDLNYPSNDIRRQIFEKVSKTPLIDTHTHLMEEKERFIGTSAPDVNVDDWTTIFSTYFNSDMRVAGMDQKSVDRFFSPEVNPLKKWHLLEPYWLAVKNTGVGQAVRIAMSQLYGVDEFSSKTIKKIQSGYEKVRRPGFYKHILCDLANIESCQVDSRNRIFTESDMPTLLMQDIRINGMLEGPALEQYGKPTGIKVSSLSDWHRVIDWWFNKYGKYAVAVKSSTAYRRDINYAKVPAEKVEAIFKKRLNEQTLTAVEKKALEDHLFWYAVDSATRSNLPVKLHTGYYAGLNRIPLSRLRNNPASATKLCRLSPETNFVFMHICYPYYEEMVTIGKHYTNGYVDMSFAWIVNPIAAKDFLKKFLVTASINKVLPLGADYFFVEAVLGHAVMARRGIALALSELVEEGWLSLDGAMEMTDPIMHGNARRLFNLAEKTKVLKNVKWGF